MVDVGELVTGDFGFRLAEIAADAAWGKELDLPLLRLLSSLGHADAAIITRRDRGTDHLRVGAVFGYAPDAIKPMTSTTFLSRDPAYSSILRDHARSPIRTWVDPDYAYDTSPAAQAFLLPAGFHGGVSIRLTTAAGGHVGDFHMSTKRRFVPSPSQMAAFDRSLKVVAALLESNEAASDPNRGQSISLVEEGRTVYLDEKELRREFASLMPHLRSQVAWTGRSRQSFTFRWLGASDTWYRIELHQIGDRMRAEAYPEALPYQLTHRELQVLDGLCEGATNSEVARSLCLSERTVAHYVERILEKLTVRTRTAAVAQAIHEGLLLTPPPLSAVRPD